MNFFPNFQFSKFLGFNALTDSPIERHYGPVEKITNFMDKLFQGNKVEKINTRIPKDIKMKIKTRFSSSNELLRFISLLTESRLLDMITL